MKLSSLNFCLFNPSFLVFLSLIFGCFNLPATLAQETMDNNSPNLVETDIRPNILLSLTAGENMIKEANKAINEQSYDIAVEKLQNARQIFNQLSNFYLQLAQNYSGIEAKVTNEAKNQALVSGQKRDETTYQLAIVHRAQNKSELAIPLLLQVIRSQGPTSEMGKKAYQQLFEIGFINVPLTNK